MRTVAIIDYGSGNLHSAAKAFERATRETNTETRIVVTSNPRDISTADRIVLPGVGAFADCKAGLIAIAGLREALEDAVIARGHPFLGICVGMQLLATRGLEFITTAGLDWIPGEVAVLAPSDASLKIPHMGWNTLNPTSNRASAHPLLAGIAMGETGQHAYFVHSYQVVPLDPAAIIATTSYGGPVTALIARENIVGTQFHPEKSQTLGLQLIANFLSWQP